MPNAMEELMRVHPASHYGRREHRPSDAEVFEELESRHLRPHQEYEADYRASQAVDRLAQLEKAQGASPSADGMDSMRLERAAYLLVVGIDRLVGAIAALGWRIVLFLARRSVTAERRSVRADETRA